MNKEQFMKNLEVPDRKVDVVLDTDTFNEIDDLYAIAYLIGNSDKMNTKAIYAAPFFNAHSTSPGDGMEKSYQEILRLLTVMKKEEMKECAFRGSDRWMEDEKTPVDSPAARHLASLAMNYTPENPLYVIVIGATTNIGSALLMNPEIAERIVIVFQGMHTLAWPDPWEYNMCQDMNASRVMFNSGAPMVILPAMGMSSAFTISGAELVYWLKGKNAICDYLVDFTLHEIEFHDDDHDINKPWSRIIWDVTSIAWVAGLVPESYIIPTPIPESDKPYGYDESRRPARYIYNVQRDIIVNDLFDRLIALQ